MRLEGADIEANETWITVLYRACGLLLNEKAPDGRPTDAFSRTAQVKRDR